MPGRQTQIRWAATTSRYFPPYQLNSPSSQAEGNVHMARRRASLLNALLVLPWWASVIIAAMAFALLKFAAPLYFASAYTAGIGTVATNNAAPVAGFFLLIGSLSFIRALFIKRKFNSLAGIEHVRQLSWRQFESIVGE